MRAGRRDVPITHPDKVLFPDDGITKGDLAAYYRDAAPQMVPLVKDRPVSMQRFNAGIAKGGFFQKNLPKGAPGWLKTATVAKRDGTVTHPLVTDASALVWLANQNCVTPHLWLARADRPERPDRMVFDLDPSDDDFGLVRRSALVLGEILREAGVVPWAMTTGSRGLHVVVALRRRHGFTAVRDAAVAIGEELVARDPQQLTLAFLKKKRGGRLYVDVNRNGYAATAVAPFGVRARRGAPVATPLRWEELEDPALAPDRWTLRDVLDRDAGAWDGVPAAAGPLPRT
jgi:bifunctional non-homologous end joining protein LigD